MHYTLTFERDGRCCDTGEVRITCGYSSPVRILARVVVDVAGEGSGQTQRGQVRACVLCLTPIYDGSGDGGDNVCLGNISFVASYGSLTNCRNDV